MNTAEIAFAFALLAAGVDARGLVPVLIFGVGLVQLIYVLPLYYLKRRSREGETAKGIVIAASLTGLWNATCWGAVHGFFR